ncbi:hypothetical protein BJV74DRAFT_111333 [Russula compacta]|nr:hypothetical protein BJV74DRAFT_111333 [Russula compacta]
MKSCDTFGWGFSLFILLFISSQYLCSIPSPPLSLPPSPRVCFSHSPFPNERQAAPGFRLSSSLLVYFRFLPDVKPSARMLTPTYGDCFPFSQFLHRFPISFN